MVVELAYSVDRDEVAHHEPSHQDLHCLISILLITSMKTLGQSIFRNFADLNFVVCYFDPLMDFLEIISPSTQLMTVQSKIRGRTF